MTQAPAPKPDPAPGAALATPRLARGEALQSSLRTVTIAWMFGSAWVWTVNGAVMTQFAKGLHTPDWGFGVLAALPFVGTLFQLPAGFALDRFGHRKTIFLIFATLSRMLWSVIALVPWVLPGKHAWWWPTMAALIGVSWALANVTGPAWMNWMSDLIPRRVRGRFFALRNNVGQVIGLLITLGIGYLLDRAEGDGHAMLRVTSVLLAVAGLLGTIDILCFFRVPDAEESPRPLAPQLGASFLAPLADANFRRFLLFNALFTFAIGYIGQYVWLFLLDVLQWSNAKANLLLIAVPLAARVLVYNFWGRLIDRLGKKPVILISGAFTTFGAIVWVLITPERFWLGYFAVLLVTMAWPGFEVANFNMILDLSGGRGRGAGAYVALTSVACAIAGILSGVFGGLVAKLLGDWTYDVGFWGIVLTYHGVLFLISTGLRGIAVWIAAGLHEPRTTATRDTIRIITGEFYSNVKTTALLPARVAGHLMRLTYRVDDTPSGKPPRRVARPS